MRTEVTRADNALGKIFDWKQTPGKDAYKRYFKKFIQPINQSVSKHFFTWFFQNITVDHFTLDIDSTIMTRYGSQHGAKKGYNPKKKGRVSHHPLIAFVDELHMVANFWLRSGKASSANNFVSFLAETLTIFGDKKIGLVRLNSGFCQKDVFDYLEDQSLNYIVAAKFVHPIQCLIDKQQSWITIDDGIQICSKTYQAQSWDKARRIVIVRQQLKQRPKATGKTLSLFPEEELHRSYRYSAYITNQNYSATDVWRNYRGRADCENRIKELKQDFGTDNFCLKDFWSTGATLIFVMIAYNLMSVFRLFVLQEKTQKTLSTLRYKVFAIGVYFQKSKDSIKLKVALHKKRRKWFLGIWDYPLDLPLKIPNL